MPSGPRIRANNVFGTLDASHAAGTTTLTSQGLVNLPAVSSAHAMIVIDPLRTAGAPELVIVTAHTGSADTATVTRGAGGTTARSHAAGVLWLHAPTIEDVIRIVTSSTRPSDPYQGQLIYETDTDSYVGRDAAGVWQRAVALGAWTTFTPTLIQSGAVTKTVGYAKYARVGRLIVAECRLAVTGTGTAGQPVVVGLPVASVASDRPIGSFHLIDISAVLNYTGTAIYEGAWGGVLGLGNAQNAGFGQAQFTAALASGDFVGYAVAYEAAA